MRQARFSDARVDFEEARRLNPADPSISRGLALMELGDSMVGPKEAAEIQATFECRDLSDLNARLAACDHWVSQAAGRPASQAMAYDARSVVKLRQRDTSGAIEDLDKAIALAPDKPELKEHRLRALFMHGDYRTALPGLIEFLKTEPYNGELRTIVATIHYVDGRRQDALSEFDEMRMWNRLENLPAARAVTIRLELQTEGDPFEDLTGRPMALWLDVLVRYRRSQIAEDEFRSDMPVFLPQDDGLPACLIEFQVAHKAALANDAGAARTGFGKAIDVCSVGEFEYHAAKAWLKRIDG